MHTIWVFKVYINMSESGLDSLQRWCAREGAQICSSYACSVQEFLSNPRGCMCVTARVDNIRSTVACQHLCPTFWTTCPFIGGGCSVHANIREAFERLFKVLLTLQQWNRLKSISAKAAVCLFVAVDHVGMLITAFHAEFVLSFVLFTDVNPTWK